MMHMDTNVIGFAVTVAATVAGAVWNRADISAVRSEMGAVRSELGAVRTEVNSSRADAHKASESTNTRIDRIADDLKQFYLMLGKHDGRLDAIERKQ
jgi:outer membrane murein-binding lipoprotein Lpp